MNRIWLDVSNRIDPVLAEALGEIDRLAADLGIPFAVVGATARDMVLHHGFGLEVRRATRDIDLALEIAHWDTFQGFENALLATGRFAPTAPLSACCTPLRNDLCRSTSSRSAGSKARVTRSPGHPTT